MKLKRKMFAGPFAASTFGRMIGANNWSNIGHLMSGKVNQATNLATRQSVKINPVTNKGVGTIAGNLVKGIAKPAALVGTAATVAGLGAKGVVSKASEQSDGSRVFSDIEIMKTYTLKRKTYSDGEEKKSNLGRNLALGAATVGTLALGAKAGMAGKLGGGVQKSMGRFVGNTGRMIGNDNMMLRGAKAYGQGQGTILANRQAARAASGKGQAYSKQKVAELQAKSADAELNYQLKRMTK